MNRAKINEFATLTKRQLLGDSTSRSLLAVLKPALVDGYCLFNAYEQWQSAFSYEPGREEALAPIATLADKITRYTKDDTLQMYAEPEWKTIISLRGPFDCAIDITCGHCGHHYVGFGQSGFDDRVPAVCDLCGDVCLQSGYDKSSLPRCECGGSFRFAGCPRCQNTEVGAKRYFSGYEYFKDHKWTERTANQSSQPPQALGPRC